MRFAVFLAVVVATFVATYSSFANAENIALVNSADRRLRVADAVEEERDGVTAAAAWISKLKEQTAITKANKALASATTAAKLSDDEMVKLSKMFDDMKVRNTKLDGITKGVAKLSDDQIAKVTKMVEKMNKEGVKGSSRMKKALVITAAVGGTGAVLYLAYKLLGGKSTTQAPTTTTTDGSA
uniref:PaRXLR29 n=1 Tax=Phytophthora agathidicida TaxID=1642459 RepID=A0A7G4WI18_9STRA|nr:PaRXLR29 [Phytophthora agathidicida]